MEGSRWVLIGRGAMILGIVNLVRLIAERVMVGSGAKATYAMVLTADIILSGMAIAGGRGLIKGGAWAAGLILFSVGALFVSSVVLFVWMWPYFRMAVGRGFQTSSDVILGPRLVFYALLVLACPYPAVVLVKHREPGWPSWPGLVTLMILGMTGSGAFVAFLIAWH